MLPSETRIPLEASKKPYQATFSWKISAPKCTLSCIGALSFGTDGLKRWWVEGMMTWDVLGTQKKTPKGDLGNDWDSLNLCIGVSSSPPRHGIIKIVAIVWQKKKLIRSYLGQKIPQKIFKPYHYSGLGGRVHGEWFPYVSCIHGYGIRTASGTHSNSRTEVDSVGFVWRFDDDDNMGMGTARTCKNYGKKTAEEQNSMFFCLICLFWAEATNSIISNETQPFHV